MALSQKHYRVIAEIIREVANTNWVLENVQPRTGVACALIADKLADFFEENNPRFNRHRFFEACGVEK